MNRFSRVGAVVFALCSGTASYASGDAGSRVLASSGELAVLVLYYGLTFLVGRFVLANIAWPPLASFARLSWSAASRYMRVGERLGNTQGLKLLLVWPLLCLWVLASLPVVALIVVLSGLLAGYWRGKGI